MGMTFYVDNATYTGFGGLEFKIGDSFRYDVEEKVRTQLLPQSSP